MLWRAFSRRLGELSSRLLVTTERSGELLADALESFLADALESFLADALESFLADALESFLADALESSRVDFTSLLVTTDRSRQSSRLWRAGLRLQSLPRTPA
jgi:hypothetical protein